MTQPGWYCEHCDLPIETGIADEAEVSERQKCPKCRHWTVAWLTPEQVVQRFEAHQLRAETFSPRIKTEQAGIAPAEIHAAHDHAMHWFAQMRAAVEAAPDIAVSPSGTATSP